MTEITEDCIIDYGHSHSMYRPPMGGWACVNCDWKGTDNDHQAIKEDTDNDHQAIKEDTDNDHQAIKEDA